MMQMYGEVSPDLPGRIMAMAEAEQRADIEVITGTAKAEQFAVRVGALGQPILILVLMALAAYLFHDGANAGAFTALVTGIGFWIVPAIAEMRKKQQTSPPATSSAQAEGKPPKPKRSSS